MPREYTAAAYCRRGHWNSWDITEEVSDYCDKCGASVLIACPACRSGIPGLEVNPTVAMIGFEHPTPQFCGACGAPFPWVGRQGRIYELQNRLDREQLDPADELTVREQLDALANPDLSDEEQVERWSRVRRLAPGLLQSGQRIVETLVSGYAKQELGL